MTVPSTYAEIKIDSIKHNFKAIQKIVRQDTRIMAVVKANAYGHGIVEIAKAVAEMGAGYLGVARLEEAVDLRESGVKLPILILGYTSRSQFETLCHYDITQTIYNFEEAKCLSECAVSIGKCAKAHIKIDTGMGRIGMIPENLHRLSEEIEGIAKLKRLDIEGIFTHFASADSPDKSYARYQFDTFTDLLDILSLRGIHIPLKHAANSAAIIDLPETHLDMVRPGISLYGLYPSQHVLKEKVALLPAMELKSRVIQLKHVSSGFKVSYGSTFVTKRPTTIATVPVGYADGYNRLLSSKGVMLVNGYRVPVIGRVCMDLIMLDVGDVGSDIRVEDEVVVFGRQGNASVSIDEIASLLDTINYEIVTSVTSRVKRVYIP